ncbi:hypothetical protein, partial [Cellvibrio mixtus]|uniref:hypothetical protein n=1 Tax=Cellvibrio mixtus TaxID=39650 RepID=UPI00190F6439
MQRTVLKKSLVSDISNPHFAMIRYWDYFYSYESLRTGNIFLDKCAGHIKAIFENRNSDPGYSIGNTNACVNLIGEWYWEDVVTHYIKEFKKFEKYVVCLGFNDEDFDGIWTWYSEGCKYPFVTYSQEETQGWAAWYVTYLDEEYPGAKNFLYSVFRQYFDPEERLALIRKKISGELEWSFGLVDT